MQSVVRRGTYYRVFKPDWGSPLDMSFSRAVGGRWNPPGTFGALYLTATIEVAAANARAQHAGRAIGLFDLRPDRRPHLLQVHVVRSLVLDVVNANSIRSLRLPITYPWKVSHHRCQPIGVRAYSRGVLRGVACRSAAECSNVAWLGEELAYFDSAPRLRENGTRKTFAEWYPDVVPL